MFSVGLGAELLSKAVHGATLGADDAMRGAAGATVPSLTILSSLAPPRLPVLFMHALLSTERGGSGEGRAVCAGDPRWAGKLGEGTSSLPGPARSPARSPARIEGRVDA